MEDEFDFQCKICFVEYNESSRFPMLICKNSHFACRNCTYYLGRYEDHYECPFCKKRTELSFPVQFKKILSLKKISKEMDKAQDNLNKKINQLEQQLLFYQEQLWKKLSQNEQLQNTVKKQKEEFQQQMKQHINAKETLLKKLQIQKKESRNIFSKDIKLQQTNKKLKQEASLLSRKLQARLKENKTKQNEIESQYRDKLQRQRLKNEELSRQIQQLTSQIKQFKMIMKNKASKGQQLFDEIKGSTEYILRSSQSKNKKDRVIRTVKRINSRKLMRVFEQKGNENKSKNDIE